MIVTGCAAGGVTLYSYLLTNPNDAILIPSPYYSYLDHNLSVVAQNQVIRCLLHNQNTAINKGLHPRILLLINPNNPLGDVYDIEIFLSILNFAPEKCFHVIIDEIYDFSLNGLRVGVMYTSTSEICQMSSKLNFLLVPSRNVELMLDRQWIQTYIQLNRQRLIERYRQVKTTLEMISGCNNTFITSRIFYSNEPG
ncbi:hypothetical protein I4U23_000165 [Adineta vaga]|nr:hypothetical protein I4U23_000165 [Adineta vaga]